MGPRGSKGSTSRKMLQFLNACAVGGCTVHATRKPADNLHNGKPTPTRQTNSPDTKEISMATLEKSATTTIDKTALGRLDREGRLLNAVLKSPTKKPGRFGFRGDIALKFQSQPADAKRPPEFSIEQVLTIAQEGEST